ncbi:MAG: hypothetical protein A2W31_03080 [Planctomycetes bacterium RBG_16_64_10]|nr:MAG: hypothetical protein A2W31_03080 [Planctomycetes bacterium RBG_16_64_10]
MNVAKEVAALRRMAVRDLRTRYADVFGEETRAGNKAWLIKRIGWRLQSLAEGDLSERARQQAAELANDADVRLSPPKAEPGSPAPHRQAKTAALIMKGDDRLPLPGTVITRKYKGHMLQVKVLADGFEFEGTVYKSLSAVAKAISGQHCSGYYFFRLGGERSK